MLWPFGFPARFADPGVAQTRKAQTMRAFSPGSAALLGHITRPGERAETLSLLIIVDQPTESTLSNVEGLRQGPPADKSIRPCGRTTGVGQRKGANLRKKRSTTYLSMCWIFRLSPYCIARPDTHLAGSSSGRYSGKDFSTSFHFTQMDGVVASSYSSKVPGEIALMV